LSTTYTVVLPLAMRAWDPAVSIRPAREWTRSCTRRASSDAVLSATNNVALPVRFGSRWHSIMHGPRRMDGPCIVRRPACLRGRAGSAWTLVMRQCSSRLSAAVRRRWRSEISQPLSTSLAVRIFAASAAAASVGGGNISPLACRCMLPNGVYASAR